MTKGCTLVMRVSWIKHGKARLTGVAEQSCIVTGLDNWKDAMSILKRGLCDFHKDYCNKAECYQHISILVPV